MLVFGVALRPDLQEVDKMNEKKHTTKNNIDLFHNFESPNDFLTIPDSLIAYTRDTVFSTWQVLERQLEQMDPVAEPVMYQALNDRAATLFEAWLNFRYVGRGA